jgi:hypothetical protein
VAICALAALAVGATPSWRLFAQAPTAAVGVKYAQVSPTDMREWLTYLSSDELQGRRIFTEGYGLAASYVAEHLRQWGVKPLGTDGTYFEDVKLKGYRVTRNSTVGITVNGATKTFKHGEHVDFTGDSGGKQTLSFSSVEFVGYGLQADTAGRDLKGKLVVVVPNLSGQQLGRTFGLGRAFAEVERHDPGAMIGLQLAPAVPTPAEVALAQANEALTKAQQAVQQAQAQLGGRSALAAAAAAFGQRSAGPAPDLTTVRNVETPAMPVFTADETFFEALFGEGPVKFADILAKARKGDPIQGMTLPVQVMVTVDNTFEVVREQLSRNVVGLVEGSDPKLKDTYVMFGAHLDHIGYSETGASAQPAPNGCRQRGTAAIEAMTKAGKTPQASLPRAPRGGAPGAAPLPFDQRDFISNGADDDGSGSTSELAIAKAFALGPKPKRSVVFVWHTGEEAGLYGSEYNADFPVVPLAKVQAQLNMDMVGRDDCNDVEGDFTNTVFVVGADRISTDLHNVIVETNQTMAKPMTLDYELNDPADPEDVYERSDHYSYAAKGIPIAFFTTGLHPDYHRVTDTVDKILFPKMARIAQLVYETGFSIADTDRVLERDNKGPRTGFGTKAEVIKK